MSSLPYEIWLKICGYCDMYERTIMCSIVYDKDPLLEPILRFIIARPHTLIETTYHHCVLNYKGWNPEEPIQCNICGEVCICSGYVCSGCAEWICNGCSQRCKNPCYGTYCSICINTELYDPDICECAILKKN